MSPSCYTHTQIANQPIAWQQSDHSNGEERRLKWQPGADGLDWVFCKLPIYFLQHHQLSLVMSNDYIPSINLSCPAVLSPFLLSEKAKCESRDKPTTLKQEHVTTAWHGEDQNLLGMQITAVIIRKVSGETQISRKWELICTCHRSDNQGAISVSGASTSLSLSSPQWHGDPVEREGQTKRRFGALSNKWLNTTL